MLEDRPRGDIPVGSIDPVTGSLQRQQPRAGDLVGQRLAVLEREHRIRGAVDHQRRHGDRGQRLARPLARRAGRRGSAAAAKSRARSTSRRTSSRTAASSNGRRPPASIARVADQVLDHRLRVRPVHLRRRQEPPNSLGRRRQPAVTGRRGRRADEDEREDAIGEVEREQLRERPARRHADHVRGRDAVGVEHPGGVGDQVGAGVLGAAGLVGDRRPVSRWS